MEHATSFRCNLCSQVFPIMFFYSHASNCPGQAQSRDYYYQIQAQRGMNPQGLNQTQNSRFQDPPYVQPLRVPNDNSPVNYGYSQQNRNPIFREQPMLPLYTQPNRDLNFQSSLNGQRAPQPQNLQSRESGFRIFGGGQGKSQTTAQNPQNKNEQYMQSQQTRPQTGIQNTTQSSIISNSQQPIRCILCSEFFEPMRYRVHQTQCPNALCSVCREPYPRQLIPEHMEMAHQPERQFFDMRGPSRSRNQEVVRRNPRPQSQMSQTDLIFLNFIPMLLGRQSRGPSIIIQSNGRRGQNRGEDVLAFLQMILENLEEEDRGMSEEQVDALPTTAFKKKATKAGEEEKCAICMTEFEDGEKVRELKCKHDFHPPCIDTWLKRIATCPVCKADIKEN